MRDQRIRDPIHNLIKFSGEIAEDKLLWQLIQQPAFQRLRRIKQLGISDLVYPGATHTRFSHCLGAMQTARRMLEILEKNKQIGDAHDHPIRRSAALCAVLLHDVGHGPLSHVFEQVSREIDIDIDHEEWTRKIIEHQGISNVLSKHSADMPELVSSFFNKESGYSAYSSIVSSQMDADRLDFISRDRYFAGIGFVAVDLDWLFDSLSIREIPIDFQSDAKQFVFVASPKALPVLVAYAHAYSEMYKTVYFHKTTRAAQFMIRDILKEVFGNKEMLDKMPKHDPLAGYFRSGPIPDLTTFLSLDDFALWRSIEFVAQSDFGNTSKLARRFLDRDLYKCFEVPISPNLSPPKSQINKFAQELKKNGIIFHVDYTPPKGVKQFDVAGENSFHNIFVWDKGTGNPRPLAELSPAVAHMIGTPPIRFYFGTKSEREKAIALWKIES